MFTGIVEEIGRLKNLRDGRIEISCEKILEDVKIGDSISTNGICLTVVDFGENFFAADVMPETIRKTSLEELNRDGAVNLERALKLGDRFGGHIVSGHIDGVGKILTIHPEGNAIIFDIEADDFLLRQIVTKGSVTLDGISLTVVNASVKNFSVSMIPHTRDITNFSEKKIGSLINIETDILAKYVDRLLNFNSTPDLTKDFLIENGFA